MVINKLCLCSFIFISFFSVHLKFFFYYYYHWCLQAQSLGWCINLHYTGNPNSSFGGETLESFWTRAFIWRTFILMVEFWMSSIGVKKKKKQQEKNDIEWWDCACHISNRAERCILHSWWIDTFNPINTKKTYDYIYLVCVYTHKYCI